ncbi:MAG: TonB-dependent receptor [Lysobacterales bacterium CG02_land_8_20_14_3_00_62_12]|nr:MAG: TonB-dependent receptor [Xanthomonadales bacterium CG02_land_8_20_14_3_00_62_12]
MPTNPLKLAIQCALGSTLWLTVGALATTAQAQDAGDAPAATTETAETAKELSTVTVLGSRRLDRTDATSPVPVDVIPMQESATKGGQFDVAQSLQYLAPSFNSTRQTGADGADLIDSAALRGLGSDQTLVLVNGKRHHSTALVNLFGARNRGNTGTDLNTIPLLAIDRVEVLRDGAAAQYGSDAIAGVMNFALRTDVGCQAVTGYGEYTRGDGENKQLAGYCGFSFGDGGVLAITAEGSRRGRSDRSEPADNPRTIGDTKVNNNTLFVNGRLPVGDASELYLTASNQVRIASSAAFGRGGVGSDDIPSRNSEAMFPGGFVPFINGDLRDRFFIFGGTTEIGQWHTDLSSTYGYNEMFYNISNTLNASIANLDLQNGGPGISANKFNAGGFSFDQSTTNLDFTRFFDGIAQGMNVAFGAEYRRESYEIKAGELGSYVDADGAGGGNAGSQGFPGFQPADEVNQNRNSYAGYVDVETDLTDRFTVDTAARFEHFSDFGSTLDGKLAAAFHATDALLFRGSVASGFRAPSLQQRLFSSTFTDFISGEPVDVLLAPNGGTIANAAGIPKLQEETSLSYSLGFTWQAMDSVQVTLDAYRIDIDDRIVLSGRFNTDDPDIGSILSGLGVGEAQFFVNSVDTETKGIDLTVSHDADFDSGKLRTFFALNISDTNVARIHTPASLIGREDSLLSDRERLFIEEGAPDSKAILSFDYTSGKWNPNLKFIYFGAQTLGTFSGPPVPNQHYSARASADLSLSYAFTDSTRFTVGATNIFDSFPSRQNADETDNGHVFESVQFGLNGAAWFARLSHQFN